MPPTYENYSLNKPIKEGLCLVKYIKRLVGGKERRWEGERGLSWVVDPKLRSF
jgi:hypothetical protein